MGRAIWQVDGEEGNDSPRSHRVIPRRSLVERLQDRGCWGGGAQQSINVDKARLLMPLHYPLSPMMSNDGAEGGTRTRTRLPSTVFETAASAIPPLRLGAGIMPPAPGRAGQPEHGLGPTPHNRTASADGGTLGLLTGKTALIFGVSNDRSIGWGISQAFAREGATLGFGYAEPVERWARPLAESTGATFIEPCDVAKDEEIAAVMQKAADHFGEIDVLVHSIAFAKREELSDAPYYTTSREGFQIAMDISVYSFTALARAALPCATWPTTSAVTRRTSGSTRSPRARS